MGNTILIKHGAAVPNGKLYPYELGYCDDDGLLYIGGAYKQNENGEQILGDAISINPALENARGVLGLEHGGTGISVDTVENLKAELKIVSLDGDTMTGSLTVPNLFSKNSVYMQADNGTQPALIMDVGDKNKAVIYCGTDSIEGEGGIIIRGYNGDGTDYKDLYLNYSTNMTIPISNGGTGATTAEQALINLGANNATNLTTGTLNSDRLPTITVSKGGTGCTTLTSGSALIGNGTDAIKFRAITNNISIGTAGWSTSIGSNLITLNTLAYWNGRYSGTSSNLAYCTKGAFGDIVTKQIRVGTINLTSSWASYSFSSAMSGTPRVILTPNTQTSGVIAGKVRNVTSSGFEAVIGGSVSGTISFYYIAIY